MICNPCLNTLPVPDCIDDLTIGNAPAALTDYYVFIKDNTTGRVQRETIKSLADASMVLPMGRMANNHNYEISISLTTAPDVLLPITVSGTGVQPTCIAVYFQSTYSAKAKNTTTTDQLQAS